MHWILRFVPGSAVAVLLGVACLIGIAAFASAQEGLDWTRMPCAAGTCARSTTENWRPASTWLDGGQEGLSGR